MCSVISTGWRLGLTSHCHFRQPSHIYLYGRADLHLQHTLHCPSLAPYQGFFSKVQFLCSCTFKPLEEKKKRKKKRNQFLEAMTHHKPQHLLYSFWNASLQDLEPLLEAGPPFCWSHPGAVGSSGTDGDWINGEHGPAKLLGGVPPQLLPHRRRADVTSQVANGPLHKPGPDPTARCKQSGCLGSTSQLLFWAPGSQITHWRPQPFQSQQHHQ